MCYLLRFVRQSLQKYEMKTEGKDRTKTSAVVQIRLIQELRTYKTRETVNKPRSMLVIALIVCRASLSHCQNIMSLEQSEVKPPSAGNVQTDIVACTV